MTHVVAANIGGPGKGAVCIVVGAERAAESAVHVCESAVDEEKCVHGPNLIMMKSTARACVKL